MKKQKRTLSSGPQAATHPPPRNWKFWGMVAVTIAWCGLFGVAVVNNAKKPNMAGYWADQIQAEQKAAPALPAAAKSHAPIAYPKDGDFYRLNFDILSAFPADTPIFKTARMDPRVKIPPPTAQVPPEIQALDGEKISVAGFMIPMATENGKANSFILAQTRGSCCYGLVPKLNQWIYVDMHGKGVDPTMDIPVTVFGTLAVAKDLSTQEKNWCLYRMAGEKVDFPRKFWF